MSASKAGAVAGAVAALTLVLFMTAAAAVEGRPPLSPLSSVGWTFVGPGALGALTLPYAVALHLLRGVGAGVLFAAVLPASFSLPAAAGLGSGYALGLMMLESSVILPVVNPAMRESMRELGGAWVIAYVVFGIALGSVQRLRGPREKRGARP